MNRAGLTLLAAAGQSRVSSNHVCARKDVAPHDQKRARA
jgi:hypothetical protein